MIANLENRAFILILLIVTASFLYLLAPFYAAIFWASILAILFSPFERRLNQRLNNRPTLSALLTTLASMLLVVIPLLFIMVLLGLEAVSAYKKLTVDGFHYQPYLESLQSHFPFLENWIAKMNVNWESIKGNVSKAALGSTQFLATQAFQFGQGYLQFVINAVIMLYLTFFFLRDGERLIQLLIRALPLGDAREMRLFQKFAEVCRATVKGSLVVAMVQGTIGGVAFWILGIEAAILWGTIMVVLSLLPAVGSALIWAPAAGWLILSGAWIKGVILILIGVFLIGLIDNVLRPILVGRDTKMPDYLILISTLGGISMFGLSGFVMGPVLAALFLVIWQIFMEEYRPGPGLPGEH
jgi:predicted PurR-regulated permease PerM